MKRSASSRGAGRGSLALGLHPHLIGVPHRFHELERMLDLLSDSEEVTFVTGAEIADWFAAHEPAEA